MPRLNTDQLAKHCQAPLRPIYIISGDEALLVQEACDTLRHAARQQGFSERELYHNDASMNWQHLLQSANSMSLFAERKVIEVRNASAKPSDAAKQALLEYAANPNPDTLLILIFPKLDGSTQKAKWYTALDAVGASLTI